MYGDTAIESARCRWAAGGKSSRGHGIGEKAAGNIRTTRQRTGETSSNPIRSGEVVYLQACICLCSGKQVPVATAAAAPGTLAPCNLSCAYGRVSFCAMHQYASRGVQCIKQQYVAWAAAAIFKAAPKVKQLQLSTELLAA